MNSFSKSLVLTFLVLLGSLSIQSQFVSFSTTHSSYDDGVETWDVFDVYANFSDDQYALLNVFNSDVSTNDSEGFHHNDLAAGGSWTPSFSYDITGVYDSNRDSYVNVGYGVGTEAPLNQTQLDPNFGDGAGPYIPMDAGWYNGTPSDVMYASNGQVHVGRFVTEAFRSVYFSFEAELGYNTGIGTGVYFGSGFTDANAGVVTGCTVTTACNYDSTATEDDGSCVLPNGCTDSTACNYDSTATCDDGSCATGGSIENPLMISGVIDGPLTGGTPKAVELYVIEDIADLSIYGLGSANNGDGSDGQEFTFPSVSATAGSYITIASESTQFSAFIGSSPSYTSGSMGINGDDAVELFKDGSVIDVFGDINTDGNGEPWEYLDGWAYRNSGSYANNGSWSASDWSFSGINALDGETSNSTAATPFPIGSFTTAGGVATGCTDTTACNYDSTAICDDGSCLYPNSSCDDGDPNTSNDMYTSSCQCVGIFNPPACTDSEACNYDPNAGTDDGSCVYIGEACDDFDPNTSGDVWGENCNCAGIVVVPGCTDVAACNYDSNATDDDGSCAVNDECGNCGGSDTSGCTDSTACNYDSTADCDDGSCLQDDECGDCGGDGNDPTFLSGVVASIDEDSFGDISSDATNPTLVEFAGVGAYTLRGSAGNFQSPNADPEYFSIVIPSGYEIAGLRLLEFNQVGYEAAGTPAGNGGFFGIGSGGSLPPIFSPGDFVAAANALQGGALIGIMPGSLVGDNLLDNLSEPFEFPDFGISIPGLSDQTVGPGEYTFMFKEGNSNPETVDAYVEYEFQIEVVEVGQPFDENYAFVYGCDGGCLNDVDGDLVCDEFDDCVGELDPCGDCNGSGIAGCTDSAACNYDSTATCDDGSCEFISCNSGCTYASATNYDSTATIDDGSCVFEVCDITSNDQDIYDQGYADGVASVPENTCPEDLDNDGVVNIGDLLVFLGSYGDICE